MAHYTVGESSQSSDRPLKMQGVCDCRMATRTGGGDDEDAHWVCTSVHDCPSRVLEVKSDGTVGVGRQELLSSCRSVNMID
eukprot:COSAG02_NODE_10600_length_1903_cov_2.144124_1_plen_81_part_00